MNTRTKHFNSELLCNKELFWDCYRNTGQGVIPTRYFYLFHILIGEIVAIGEYLTDCTNLFDNINGLIVSTQFLGGIGCRFGNRLDALSINNSLHQTIDDRGNDGDSRTCDYLYNLVITYTDSYDTCDSGDEGDNKLTAREFLENVLIHCVVP